MRFWIAALFLGTLGALAAAAAPLGLAWGVIAEPAAAGTLTPGQVAEHLEFLQAHGWRAVRSGDFNQPGGERSVLLSFDDPASAQRCVVPLLELYRMPAVVTVGPAQAADPALAPILKSLAASSWVELLPRVEKEPGVETGTAVRCSPVSARVDPSRQESERLSRLHQTLETQSSQLREITGATPGAVAWAPGAWSGPGETVAASLGLKVQMPTFTGMPPELPETPGPPRVARYAVPSWAGIWAPAQASVHWNPREHPVRFVEVDAAWVCAGGDPEARVARIVTVVKRLGLNGVRLLPGGPEGAWFETSAAPVRGDVLGPLSRALRAAGVRWTIVDLPAASGNAGRDLTFAADLARAVDLDVAVLPAGAGSQDRLGEALLFVRPAARLAWRDAVETGTAGSRAFHLAPQQSGGSPDSRESRGLTVRPATPAAADTEAASRAVAGWEWIGLPVDIAETGLRTSLHSLAAFALPR